jgi:hypothetical protein
MHWHRQAGAVADRLNQPVDGIRRERRAALGGEDVAAVRELLAQCCQHAQLVAPDRVNGWLAVLGAANVQGG